MTDLERITNQRDYNRRLVDHQKTVIDRLNARNVKLEMALLKISKHDVPPLDYFNGKCAHGRSVDLNCHGCTKAFALSLLKEPTQ